MLPNFHDWEIVEVSIDRINSNIKIVLTMPDMNEKRLIFLNGVTHFYLSGMRIQNVILDLLLFNNSSEKGYFKYCCSILQIDPSLFSAEKMKIIYFEPSVGAEIACCFSHYSLE